VREVAGCGGAWNDDRRTGIGKGIFLLGWTWEGCFWIAGFKGKLLCLSFRSKGEGLTPSLLGDDFLNNGDFEGGMVVLSSSKGFEVTTARLWTWVAEGREGGLLLEGWDGEVTTVESFTTRACAVETVGLFTVGMTIGPVLLEAGFEDTAIAFFSTCPLDTVDFFSSSTRKWIRRGSWFKCIDTLWNQDISDKLLLPRNLPQAETPVWWQDREILQVK
jgi:hypothetical protein